MTPIEHAKHLSTIINRNHNALILRIKTKVVDSENVAALSEEFLPMVVKYRRLGVDIIVLDFRSVDRIDRAGIEFMLWAWKMVGESLGASVRVCVENEDVIKTAHRFFAHYVVRFFDSPMSAIMDA